ncbi:tripartite tricarboxylate transporter TctB family protein [Marinobacterium mangrovicola]|uniref:Tripartite tricarboxylate transporter TctB family protein n=1 Tax=Marinobacterium mangrovicola TaxID=1476959 RepID=A0A4R1GH34_9GAMM|nr:tripartite tricarboxylate transporter TctB family protein [Marinobacterium mangrovicola]TCK07408.1 tripartite tricarboxylate transporter TctB family protein [Marinobacterium mangrovicola]
MLRLKEQQIFYLLLIVAAGYFLSMAQAIPTGMGVKGDPGAGFLPFWISLLIILLTGYLLIKDLFSGEEGESQPIGLKEAFALVITLAAIAGYILLLTHVGFLISTLVFLFGFRLLVDKFISGANPGLRSILASALFSAVSSGFIYLVFAVIFELSLP